MPLWSCYSLSVLLLSVGEGVGSADLSVFQHAVTVLPGWSDVAGAVYLIQEHVWELPRGRCQCHTDERPSPDGLLAFPALPFPVSQVNSHTESQWFPTVLTRPGPGLGLAVSFVEHLINAAFSHYIGILQCYLFFLSYLLCLFCFACWR